MQNTPDYLYHYTSIETLALILANHTFRLTSLDQMDDLQEKEAFDLKNAGQFCYISSWTDDETENIPMWKMYSSLSSGVRIKLKANPFKEFENTPSSISEVTHQTVTDNSNGSYLKSIIPIADMLKNGFIAPGALGNNILHKVEYTSDSDKLYPKLLTQDGDKFSIALGNLGKHKNIHWAFQHEWRYILLLMPLNLNQAVDKSIQEFQTTSTKILLGQAKQTFPFYDLTLDENAYAQMEITLSPKISAGNRLIINSLIEKYNPSAILHESSLVGLIYDFVIILLSQTVVRILSRQPFFYTVRYYFSLFYILHSTEKPVEPNFYGYLTFGHNANAILTTRVAGSFFVSQSFVFGTTKNFSMGNRISRTIRRITAFSQCRPTRFSERLPAP